MMRHLMLRSLRYLLALGLIVAAAPSVLRATPYASNVVVTGGTSVSFILNEPSTSLSYTVNGGAPQTLDGSTKGTKTFSIPAGATFSIVADSTEATGYTIPTGGTIAAVASTGLSQTTNQVGTNIISDDTSSLSRYNSPRGVSVSLNPNSSNFGTAYINNSAAGTLTGGNVVGPNTAANVGRTLTGKGLYAVSADESDAFGNGDAAVNPTNIDTFPAFATAVNQYGTSVSNSAYRIRVGDDGTIWASDYSDVNGQLFNIQPNLTGGATTSTNIFADFGGPPQPTAADGTTVQPTADGTGLGPDPGCTGALRGCTPNHQNHGSISSSWSTGSLAGGNLVVYTLDEDLDSEHFGGSGPNSQSDRNSIWQYNIGGSIPTGGSTVIPTQLAPGAQLRPLRRCQMV